MSRAGALWNALTDTERLAIASVLPSVAGGRALLDNIRADALHAPTRWAPALIPETDAGPRLPPEHCDGCGEPVTTGLTALMVDAHTVQMLGPRCWRDRMLARRRGDDMRGEQLELGEAT